MRTELATGLKPLLVAGLLGLIGLPTAQAAPNTFNTALPVAKGEFIWREQLVVRNRSGRGPTDRDVSVRAIGNVLGYGVTPRLAVFGAIPYFLDKSLDVTTPMGRINRDTQGFGDFTAFGRYTLFRDDFTGGTFRTASVFGITAPTGDHNDRDRFGELPRPLQPGDGAWDGFVGVVATYQTLQYEVDAQVLYRENGRRDGFAAGDETRFDTSLQYRIWPLSLKGMSGTPGFVYALLESNLIHHERDEFNDGVTDRNSGGFQWLIAPGLQYVGRRWILEGSLQVPLASAPNGDAIQDDAILRLGFRRNF